tara:strand:+ start:2084 stop:2317 length:234 start_codon:yes stop_codon:yes gene_type:complete
MGGSRWLLPLIVVLLGVIAVVTATLIITGPVPAPFERPGRIGLDIPEIVPPNAPRLPDGPVVPPVDPRVGPGDTLPG